MWPDVVWNICDGQRDRLGIFAEWAANWSERWTPQAGVRHETVEMSADEVQGYSPMYDPVSAAAFNAAKRAKTDRNRDLSPLARATPSARQRYEFGISRQTRSPNLYERYSWSTHGVSMRMVNMAGDGNGYVGNMDLEPETAYTVSATADWHDAGEARWSVKLMPFCTQVEDYIDDEQLRSAPSARQP